MIDLNLSEKISRSTKRHCFQPTGDGTCVVRGNISKWNRQFLISTRNKQDPAICIVAAAMSLIKDPRSWSSDVIDLIIKSGDNLYKSSITAVHKNQIKLEKLQIFHILRNLYIHDYSIDVSVLAPIEGSLTGQILESTLKEIIKKSSRVYLNLPTNGDYLTIITSYPSVDKEYFLFDCGNCDRYGNRVKQRKVSANSGATPCLIKFRTMARLIQHIIGNFGHQEMFSMGPIIVGLKEKA